MAVKIRLARRGRRKQPYYHIIVADARSPRDGKFIERIGSYNPMSKPATIELDRDKAFEWLQKGAQPTDTARSILRFKGVLYRTHLQRGVTKGAMTQEEADALYNEYVTTKEAKVAERFLKSKEERLAFHKKVSGTPSKVYVEETAAEEALNEFQEPAASDEGSTEAVVETPETSGEAPASEATPVVEDAVPEPAAPEAEPAAPVADETTEAPVVVAAEAEDKAETKAEAETVEAPATEVKDESPATNSESTTQEEE